jgi:hypothetical protein
VRRWGAGISPRLNVAIEAWKIVIYPGNIVIYPGKIGIEHDETQKSHRI